MSLTHRQFDILRIIAREVDLTGRPPTGTELMRHLGMNSTSAVYRQLGLLQDRGYLVIDEPRTRRTPLKIKLTDRALSVVRPEESYPWLGQVPAGPFADAADITDEFVTSPADLVPGLQPGDYFLEVDGVSMIRVGILPGMVVVLRPNQPPSQGDICSVYVDGEGVTLKRVFSDGRTTRLVAENDDLADLSFPAEEVLIQGVLVSAISVLRF